MEEEIIFSIEMPGADKLVDQLEALKKAQIQLKEEQQALTKAYKAGDITLEEYSKETVRVANNAKVVNSEFSKTQKQVTGVKSSFDELNESTKKSNANFEQLLSGVDRLIPGVDVATKGIGKFTQSALTFIATPLGVVVAAIGLAFGALMSYFKGSEEGQNNLNKVVAVGSALFEQLMNVVEAVGKVIFDAISNPKQAIIDFANLIKDNIINRFEGLLELLPALGNAIGLLFEGKFSEAGKVAFDAVVKVTAGVENASSKIEGLINNTIELVNAGIEAGKKLADLQAKIDKDERALVVERAKVSLEVSKLRAEAVKQEGDVKRATVEEAIKLEEQLADKEVKLAKVRLANAKLLMETNGDDKAALDEVAKATAAVAAAEEQRFSATLRFQKELEKLREEEVKEQERIEEEQRKNNEEFLERQKKEREEQAEIEREQAENNRKYVEDQKKKAAAKEVEIEKIRDGRLVAGLNKLTKDRIDAQKVYGNFFKAGAAKETIANTKAAAMGAYKALASIPYVGPVLGAAAYAYILATGLADAAGIQSIQFARGGIADRGGVLNGPSHAKGGIPFSVGGRLGFEAEGGEAIINKRSTAMFRNQLSAINQAGGGTAFAVGGIPGEIPSIATSNIARASESAASQREFFEAIAQIRPVVTVEDINSGQNRVQVIEDRATVLQ